MGNSIQFLPQCYQEIEDIQGVCSLIDRYILEYFFVEFEKVLKTIFLQNGMNPTDLDNLFQKINVISPPDDVFNHLCMIKVPFTKEILQEFIFYYLTASLIDYTVTIENNIVIIKMYNGDEESIYKLSFVESYLRQQMSVLQTPILNYIITQSSNIGPLGTKTIDDLKNKTIKQIKLGEIT